MRRLVVLAAAAALATGFVLRGGGSAATPPRPQPVEPVAVAPTGVGDTAHLQPALQRAVDRAIAAAAADGVELRVTSGWRSSAEQEQLFADAVRKYGSPELASHWVLPPDRSEHVKGLAVDVGPAAGARWLERHGVHFGLCRRYANEPWHFERLAAARGSACPAMRFHA